VFEQPVVEDGSTGISPSRELGVPGGVVGIEVTHKEVGGVEGERVMPTLQLICGDGGGAHVGVGDDKGCGLGVVCAGAQLQSEGFVLVRIPVAGECTVGIPLTHEDSHASAGLEGQPRSKDGVISRDAGRSAGVRVSWSRRRSTGGWCWAAMCPSTAREGAEAPLMFSWSASRVGPGFGCTSPA